MKIAILTQPLSTNYGGILQAWALQQVLIQMGHCPLTVDRKYNLRGTLSRVPGQIKSFLQDIVLRPRGKTLYQRHLDYVCEQQSAFISKNIRLSPRLDSDAALRHYFQSNRFDAVIVGSDQVWRPRYSPRLETYFLDFVDGMEGVRSKRLAYAASFGVDAWEYSAQQTAACSALARQFDGISVRESTAIDLCRLHLGVDAECVLDPTLLVDRENYVTSFCSGYEEGHKGLYTYLLDRDTFKAEVVSQVARTLDLPTFGCQPRERQSIVTRKELSQYQFPATDAWVRGFRDAEFVVTDSFHGTVFALIFEKPFIAIANHDRGSARFESLLRLVGMEDRLIFNRHKASFDHLIGPVDFSGARRRLAEARARSFDFLGAHL